MHCAACAELGLIVAQGPSKVEELVAIIEDPDDGRLPPLAREALGMLVEQLRSAQARIKVLEATPWHRSNQASRRLATIPGVGVITATALVATIGDGASSARADSSRPGSVSSLERRQGQAGANIEARGWLYQALARAWCANGAALAPRQAGSASRLDRPTAGAAAHKRRARRHGLPASPGHCSGTSVSTNRCPLNKLESGHQLARVRRFDGETGQHPRSAKPEALSEL